MHTKKRKLCSDRCYLEFVIAMNAKRKTEKRFDPRSSEYVLVKIRVALRTGSAIGYQLYLPKPSVSAIKNVTE